MRVMFLVLQSCHFNRTMCIISKEDSKLNYNG